MALPVACRYAATVFCYSAAIIAAILLLLLL